jgi:type 1 fimbria pilin
MAINLLRNFNPIYFGPPSSAANNPGQILLGNANAGAYNFPITARLMRTGPMRALPAFAAAATMTMRYE